MVGSFFKQVKMSLATHYIEIYKNEKGEVKTANPAIITWIPLGMQVKGWETLKIINIRIYAKANKESTSK